MVARANLGMNVLILLLVAVFVYRLLVKSVYRLTRERRTSKGGIAHF
jgi:hypothetical protein